MESNGIPQKVPKIGEKEPADCHKDFAQHKDVNSNPRESSNCQHELKASQNNTNGTNVSLDFRAQVCVEDKWPNQGSS